MGGGGGDHAAYWVNSAIFTDRSFYVRVGVCVCVCVRVRVC
jgi:hypothetical protein